MTTTPPGWYDDGHGALRWWDGAQWTEHVHVPEAAPTSAQPEPAPQEEPAAAQSEHPVVPPLPTSSAAAAAAYPGAWQASDPAADLAAAAPPAQPAPPKSRLWIVFAIVGVVVVLLIVLAAVFIPMAIRTITDAASQGVTAEDADETAALDAVDLYDEAWTDADCEKFEQATTEDFRLGLGMSDCATFTEQATLFGEATSNYDIVVTDISREGSTITVETDETYLSYYDDLGEQVDDPISYTDHYSYTIVSDGGVWLIDDTQVS